MVAELLRGKWLERHGVYVYPFSSAYFENILENNLIAVNLNYTENSSFYYTFHARNLLIQFLNQMVQIIPISPPTPPCQDFKQLLIIR